MADNDNEKVFKCGTCEIYFAQKDTLDEHVKNHVCEKPFKCNQCSESFTKKFNLSVHIKSVHERKNKKTYECLHCGEEFPTKYYLKIHMTDHTESLFKCDICRKSFVFKSNLSEHIKSTHLGKKRFKCHQCNKAFTRKYYLSVHIKSGHKHCEPCVIQKCNVCDKEFKNKTNLKLHVKRHAKPECPLCYQTTQECACSWNPVDDRYDRLKNRFARENLMIRCQTCSKPILRNSQLKMHLRIHRDYKCILCNEDYKSCSCCDDYMQVSKAVNTYQKAGKSSKGKTPKLEEGLFTPVGDELAAKEPVELNETIVSEDDKCTSCNEDYKSCTCSNDYLKVTKSVNTYRKTSKSVQRSSEKIIESVVEIKEEEDTTPIAESAAKSIDLSEVINPKKDDISFNEDDYMKVTKSINTYQKKRKYSNIAANKPLKDERIDKKEKNPVNELQEKSTELNEVLLVKEEPKEENFEMDDNSVESFAAEVDDVKEESIEL